MTKSLAAALLVGTSLFASAAWGQTASEAVTPAAVEAEASSGDDIIVTARRRNERLQDVPVAITAIGQGQLERANVTGLLDIRKVAPSLNISQSAGGGRNIPLFTIRGQRQGDTLASVDPSVGVYMGDQLFKRTYGLDQIIFDMGTVEVLKGPQGTLFGLNTTGGNVVFRPNLPTDEFSASLQLALGNYDYRGVEGYINVPLAPAASLRIAGQYRKRDGYIRSVVTGQRAQDLDGGAVRATLKLGGEGPVESIFTGSYIKSSTSGVGYNLQVLQPFTGVNGNGVPAGLTDVNCGGVGATCAASPLNGATGYPAATLTAELAAAQAVGHYQNRQETRGFAKTDPAWNVANTTSYKLSDQISIKNIIGYRKYTTEMFEDVDGSALALLENGNRQVGKEFSEEFQLIGDMGSLNWIAGAYYFNEKVNSRSIVTGQISPALLGLSTPFSGLEIVENESTSIFASATQKIGDAFSLTAGGRYTWDNRDASFGFTDRLGYVPGQLTGLGTASAGQGCRFNAVTDPNLLRPEYNYNPANCRVAVDKSFNAFTYTVSADWKVGRNQLIYVAHRKGYRSGGFGTRGANSLQLAPYNPEVVRDAEIGGKFDFNFDGGAFLRVNAAAYKQWYKGIQRSVSFVIPPSTISTNIVNAANATITGFELETTFRPVKALEFGGFVSHVSPDYKRFSVASARAGGLVDVAGTAPFSGVPEWQYGIRGTVNLPTAESFGAASVSLDYYHQSSFRMQDATDAVAGGATPGYGLLNARIQLSEIGGSGFDAALFATNLLNNKHFVGNYSLASSFGFGSRISGPPRMYGLELRFNF